MLLNPDMGRAKSKEERAIQRQRKLKRDMLIKQLKPLFWAVVAWFILLSIIHLPFIKGHVRDFFVSFNTHSAYWFGKILGLDVVMPAVPFLTVNGFSMRVVMECTAYNFYLFALTLCIFAQWPLKQKFISLGIFLLVIFILNNLRFITMGYLGSFRPDLFDTVHDVVWNILFGFMVFGIWAWREISINPANKASVKHINHA
jgi:exosortase/archaeosortase family protein